MSVSFLFLYGVEFTYLSAKTGLQEYQWREKTRSVRVTEQIKIQGWKCIQWQCLFHYGVEMMFHIR